MKRKMHPADIADRELIAQAIEFTAFLRIGPFEKIIERAASLSEAAAKAEAIVATHRGRAALVYAVLADGRSIPVPMDMRNEAIKPKEKTMTDTKLSGTDIAKLTATITGGGFKRANSKEAAIKRFKTVAAEIMGEAAIQHTLKQPTFDEAQSYVLAVLREMKATANNAPATKPAKAAPAEKAERKPAGKRAAILEAAQRGELPEPPDFSANTHKPHRKKLAEVVALVEAGDVKALKAFAINPISSSPKAIARYRDLAVIALEAKKAA